MSDWDYGCCHYHITSWAEFWVLIGACALILWLCCYCDDQSEKEQIQLLKPIAEKIHGTLEREWKGGDCGRWVYYVRDAQGRRYE